MIAAIARAISDAAFMYGWGAVGPAERRAWLARAHRAYEQVVGPQLRDLRERAQIGLPNARHVVIQEHVLQELQRGAELTRQRVDQLRRGSESASLEADRLRDSLAQIAATMSGGAGSADV